MEFPSFLVAYYCVAGVALAGSWSFFLKQQNHELAAVRAIFILMLIVVYIFGMLRTGGPDFGTYARAFYGDYEIIPDVGYQVLMYLFNTIGLPYQSLMLLVAVVTIFSFRRAAKYFSISFGLLFLLYFLHLAVIRDFSQLRVGLSIALAIYGITSSGKLKRGTFYLLASSVHFSSLAFIFVYEFCRWAAKLHGSKKQVTIIVFAVLGILLLGSSVQYIGFLDPRIDLYMSWKSEYSSPVGQYLAVLFQLSILLLAYFTRKSWQHDIRMRTLFFIQILGIAVFVAFIDIALFAFRLSSVVLSLYPVLLISVLSSLRLRVDGHSIARMLASLIFFIVGIILIFRPGSFSILELITFDDFS